MIHPVTKARDECCKACDKRHWPRSTGRGKPRWSGARERSARARSDHDASVIAEDQMLCCNLELDALLCKRDRVEDAETVRELSQIG